MKDTTFVTALYNIGRKHDEEIYSFENYFNWLCCLVDKVSDSRFKLIIFIPKEIFEKFQKKDGYILVRDSISENIYHIERKEIIIYLSEEIPLMQFKEDYIQCWEKNKYWTNNPKKDTIEFAILTHAKFLWLEKGIQMNPFSTSFFGWIDAGIVKVVKPSSIDIMTKMVQNNQKIKICQINDVNIQELIPLFYLSCKYKFAGGFFTGSDVYLIRFIEAMKILRERLHKDGIFGFEQEYMAAVYIFMGDIFDPYRGDFQYIFENYPYKHLPKDDHQND